MTLGVCYYPEHWPESRWETDAARMRALGIRDVRIGEFAWSRLEPARDRFDFGWLDRAMEVLAGAGLRIVLGTPTATPPKWLMNEHPQIAPVDSEGRTRGFGSRRHTSFSSRACWPDGKLLAQTVRMLAVSAGLETLDLPEHVRLRNRGDIRFAFNYGPETWEVPSALAPIIGERIVSPCSLAAWRTPAGTIRGTGLEAR